MGRPVVAILCVAAVLLAGCGGTGRVRDAPVITVVTGLWPLAEAATVVGQGNVRVLDMVPAGTDPLGYRLSAGQTTEVARAAVAVEAAPSLQPSFTAAAGRTRRRVAVAPIGGDPYVWLNPYDMEAVGTELKTAFTAADPAAAATFSNGAENLQASAGSLDEDYESVLSDCPDTTLVTVTNAFTILHPRYPITVKALLAAPPVDLPTNGQSVALARRIQATHAGKVYNESWIPQSDIIEAAVVAGVGIGNLNTLAGPQSGSHWSLSADGKEYTTLTEENLGTISSALHCPNPNDEGD